MAEELAPVNMANTTVIVNLQLVTKVGNSTTKVAANEAELTNILTTAQLKAIKDENKTLPADFPFTKVVEILETADMFEKRKKNQSWTAHELEIAGAFEGMNSMT